MGTRNFMKVHANNYYVVNGENFEYEDWKDYMESAVDKVAELLVTHRDNCIPRCPSGHGMGNRNFLAKNIASYYYDWFRIDGVNHKFRIGIHIFLVSGYYQGANLDYDITLEDNSVGQEECLSQYYDESYLSWLNITEWFQAHGTISDKFGGDNYNIDKDEAGIVSKADDVIIEKIKEARVKAEEICNSLCDEPYKLECTLDNGEGIYSKTNNND